MKRDSTNRLLCILSSVALCACTTVNPYRPQPVMGESTVGQIGSKRFTYAGDLEAAMRSADALRHDYYKDLKGSAASRAAGAMSLYALGALGISATIKPEPTAADAIRTARIGALGSVAFLSTDFLVNKLHEASYAEGYNAVTCLMLQSLPLMWPQTDADAKEQAGATQSEQSLSLQSFSIQLTALEKSINKGYQQRDTALAAVGAKDPLKFNSRSLELQRAAWEERQLALYIARTALKEGRVLERLVIGSGQTLRTQVALVAAAVNTRIAATQKDLPRPKATYDVIRDFTASFKEVGEETSNALQTSKPAVGDTSAKTGTAAETAKTEAPAKADPAPEDQPATQAQLAKTQESIIKLLVDKKALAQAINDNSVKSMLKRAREDERKKIGAEAAAREQARSGEEICRSNDACSLTSWSTDTNLVHQARRPVSQALISFREVARSLSTVQQCQADGSAIVISPAETRLVTAPSVHEFVISDPDGSVPNLTLSGNTGMPDGKGLLTIIRSGLVVAQVSVGKEAPSGDLLLTATDAKGRRSKTVTLRVNAANAPAIVYPAALGGSK